MTNIFQQTAPAYYAAGLPVIPCKTKAKMPIPMGWSSYASELPTEQQQKDWANAYADGNIGLVLGPQSGMMAFDIDTDDREVIEALEELLPTSPWKRRGKKGSVWMYKFTGARTFRMHTVEGKPLLELLSNGTQVILPPSIHPDTQKPYVANCDLLDVYGKLPTLPVDIEQQIRDKLISIGIDLSVKGSTKVTEWVAAGARDSSMTAMAGLFARSVLRGERTVREVITEMATWCNNFVENVVGDDLDAKKGEMKIIEFIRRDIVEGGKALPVGWDADLTAEEKARLELEFGEDFEEWSFDRIMTWLAEEFHAHGLDDPARNRIIDDALIKFSKQVNPNPLDEERLYRFIHDANGKMTPIGGMRRRLADLRRGDKVGQDHAEIAEAVIAQMEKFGDIRYENANFYQWKGSHWQILEEHEILKVIAEDFGSLPAGKRASDHRGILATASNIVKRGLADVDIEGVNFANGFLDIQGELRDHAPKYGARYVLPYRYSPETSGTCRLFMNFLADSWGKDDDYQAKVQALREAIGATLFGQAWKFSRAICLFGVPSSGKSTTMKIVRGLVPDGSVCNIPPEEWGDKFLPAKLDGKLLNACGELAENRNIAGEKFKMIVEGEEITGQHKNGQPFDFSPTCAHWFCTNHLPKTRDTSAGFNRRWLFLEFKHAVDPKKKDRGLHLDILAQEREAIVAWAIEGFMELQASTDYTMPSSHIDLIQEIANQNNSVRYFMSAGGVQRMPLAKDGKPSCRISEQALYEGYYAFCMAIAHVRPVVLKKFRLMARELQNEFEFQIVPNGASAHYENLTLAGGKDSS